MNELNAGDPADASLDMDGDGFSNLQEYLAGTDPADAQSLLRIEGISRAANATALRFFARSNHTYTLQSCGSFDARGWNRVSDIVAAPTNRFLEVLDLPQEDTRQRYYRIISPEQP